MVWRLALSALKKRAVKRRGSAANADHSRGALAIRRAVSSPLARHGIFTATDFGLVRGQLVQDFADAALLGRVEGLERLGHGCAADAETGQSGFDRLGDARAVVAHAIEFRRDPHRLSVQTARRLEVAGCGRFQNLDVQAGEEIAAAGDAAVTAEEDGRRQHLFRPDQEREVGPLFDRLLHGLEINELRPSCLSARRRSECCSACLIRSTSNASLVWLGML